jgi:O-antigen/teichoic acid export membrane protein
MFLVALHLPLNFWYTRQKQFKITAANRVLNSLPISIAEIGGGWAGFRAGTNLVVIRFIALVISPAFLVWRLLSGDARFIVRNFNLGGILNLARRYLKFPLVDFWSVLFNRLSLHLPIILLTAFFSPAIGGLYMKAFYLLQLPSLIIGHSVGQVFLQESAVSITEGKNLAGLVEAVLNRMITLGTLPFAVLLVVSPDLFGLILGARWTEAGVYAQILMPQLYIVFVLGSIITLFGTLEKQELNLISGTLGLILRIATLSFGGLLLHDARLTLLLFMVGNVFMGLWRMSLLIRASKLSVRRPLAHFLRCVAYSGSSIIPIAAMKWWFGLESVYLVALTPIISIPYVALVLRHDFELRNLFSKYLKRVYPWF